MRHKLISKAMMPSMLRALFIHQNPPGQFRRSIRYLQTRPDIELAAIGAHAFQRQAAICELAHCASGLEPAHLPHLSIRTAVETAADAGA
jgi:hypothetical protein